MSAGSQDKLRGEVVLYQAPDGKASLDVRLERESLWLSQRQTSQLFDKDTDTVALHLRNIYSDGVEESATTEESSMVQFRIWATGVLRDHLVKGYSANANRLRDLNRAVRLIAERRPEENEVLVRIVMHLLVTGD